MTCTRILLLLSVVASVTLALDLGVSHHYRYETSIAVDEECAGDASGNFTGHGIRAKVQLTSVWHDPQGTTVGELVKIQVSEPRLLVSKKSGYQKLESDLEKISTYDSFFLLKNNRVEKFWDNPSEHSIARNLKRSIAGLLQVGKKDGEEKMDDVAGECRILYKTEGNTVRRSVGNCRHPVQDSVSSQPFGVRSSSAQQSTGIDCDLKDDVLLNCITTERVKTYSNLWKKSSICIQSMSQLVFETKSDGKEISKAAEYNGALKELKITGNLIEGNLFSISDIKHEQTPVNVIDSTKSFQESLKSTNLAKLKSASAFFKLLPIYQAATKEDILKVLENKKFGPILPQVLDLVAASVSRNSMKAALSYFGKVKAYDELLERFLISLSVLPRTESYVLEEIKMFVDKGGHHEKIEATLISTLGALLRTYSKDLDKADPQVISEILDHLENALKKCKSDSCLSACLRGLRNAAQPSSIPLLLQFALKGGKPALEALFAIRNVPPSKLSRESQERLQKIFHQVGAKQDRSSRAVAAEILLRGHADEDILKNIIGSLSDQTDQEFSSFVVSKLFRLMDEDKILKSKIHRMLTEKEISHYYSLSQKGKSSLFKRQLMSTSGLNVTYGIEMELLEGGLLKRSSFDVEFETETEASNLLSVGMFAEGMGSIAGGEGSIDDEAVDPMAGMELTLLGSSLRPYVFFSSTSELMGHAWSGTASEPTPALQGIYALSDDIHVVVLHNGMIARLELRGAMSADLSAAIQISLWNRNSQSQVKNSAALLVKGLAVVENDFAKTRGEYMLYGNSAIEFSTDSEFAAAPFKMCLQMEHPDVQIRHDFQKSVEVSEAKFSLKKTKRRKRFVPSRSYALHQNNNELCRIMKSPDYY